MHYGIIGNCKTCALIHQSGSIDWCCLPNFDSPSLFAAILDPDAGKFSVSLDGSHQTKQTYLPNTNILITEFDDGENAFSVTDFLPRYRDGNIYKKPLEIHRILKPLRGKPMIKVLFQPRLNYAIGETVLSLKKSFITACHSLENIFLYSSLPLEKIYQAEPMALTEEQYLMLTYHEMIKDPSFLYVHEVFDKTKQYWEDWTGHCRLPNQYPNEVLRSALVLKLLTYEETGAILAAATTSLPEQLGGSRNWDYRFCWLRDASLMLESLKSIGHFEEAKAFIHYLLSLFESKQSKVHIVYSLDGKSDLSEIILPHLRGYKNSAPVRIGNAAATQQQNDIFGEIIQTIYLFYCHYQIETMTDDVWSLTKFFVETIIKDWAAPDAGLWELRQSKQHFTYSKVLAWVALDRGVKIAQKIGKDFEADKWQPIAKNIRDDINQQAWSAELKSYTQVYGSKDVDASLLLMCRYGFLGKTDKRWVDTVKYCYEQLTKNDYTFRYVNDDDFGKPQSAFIVAGLWMAKALFTIDEKEKAKIVFEKILAHANHLGLLSEDIDIQTGELLGNFPQAYSHMAVINTANLFSGVTEF